MNIHNPAPRQESCSYRFDSAIVRRPADSVSRGLSAAGTSAPDYHAVVAEHDAYVDALRESGVNVSILPPLSQYPDSVFVEDPAFVYADTAIVLRPGAPSRFGEAEQIAPHLHEHFRQVIAMSSGYADGGDILRTEREVLIGLSDRTNRAGADAFAAHLGELGLECRIVETPPGVLHFKSDCSLLGDDCILTTQRLADSGVFAGYRQLVTPEGEEAAANAIRVNDVVLVSARYSRTIDKLEGEGYRVLPMRVDEIAKIDAGLSCMSLRWRRSTV